ncbi:hypothetical protein [Microvirga makkahensis]|uniref:Uncharacterized protein n=1 Tax=Microvirga makkahensis TaxID=1128670 RepID=A0A7X3MUA5_9HYPH|nr:hypothetical protein [Microvirga makkahensis]MXQ13105.1 hypothetical protein [Microvirga makkahensis]
MAYWVEVQLDKVICRDPESVTTGDLFFSLVQVVTDSDTRIILTPLRRLRSNESATYFESVYKGFVNEPAIGLVIRAWDKDVNRDWWENSIAVRQAIDSAENALKNTPAFGTVVGAVLNFAADFALGVVDQIVMRDSDDELVNYTEILPLAGAGYGSANKHTQQHEIKFRRSDPTGYSDWDYSLFLTISHYQTEPSFGTTTPPTWENFSEPSKPSRPQNWIGTWSSPEAGPVVSAVIKKGSRSHLLDVSITENVNGRDVVTTTNDVPISRVFLEAGHRTLESDGSPYFDEWLGDRGFNLSHARAATRADAPMNRFNDLALLTSRSLARESEPVTRFSLERSHGTRVVARETLYGAAFEPSRVVFKQQIGTDCIVLNNRAVLEAYRLLHDGQDVGDVALRYLRPVTNILFRETGSEVAAYLFWVVTDIH